MLYTKGRYGAIPRKDWGGALTGASSGFKMGASVGTVFGPIGAGIAGGIGALVGGIFGNKKENDRDREQRRLDAQLAKDKAAAKAESDALFKKNRKSNDASYLANFDLNEQGSLFMPQGGKVSPASIKLAEKGAKEYRDNIASFDSLRTILRPHLVKSGKDHLKSDDIKKILGDKGYGMYNNISDYLSNAYSVNPKLGVDMNEFRGSLEDPNNKIDGYLYGKKIDSHKFPNAEFPIINTKTKEQLYNTKAYPDSVPKPSYMRAKGGKIRATGRSLGNSSKLLTKNGSTTGSHETGQNIPIVKNGKAVAIAEPGEVLTKDRYGNDFVLSKRLGFAQQFMNLEQLKNSNNKKVIEERQDKIIDMNNRITSKRKRFAAGGINLGPNKANTSNLNLFDTNIGIQKYTGSTPTINSKSGLFSNFDMKGLNTNTIAGGIGTIGNLIMSNKTLKRQKGLITNSLNEALDYQPRYNKNYLLNDTIDVSDQVSSVNQGYSSAVAGLDGIDPAIASAIKSSANVRRVGSLNSIYGERNRGQIGLRNQNTMNIMNTANANDNLTNQTNLMKLNAKISANEQFSNAEAAGLANKQAAIGEFNTILRDQNIMNSLNSRWVDSIGNTFAKAPNIDPITKLPISSRGGRIGRRKRRFVA